MTRIHSICLTVLFTALGLSGSLAANDDSTFDLLITDSRVIVGDGSVLDHASVGIVGDRILWIGTGSPETKKARVLISGEGTTVIPGLIDMHVHLLSSDHITDGQSLESYMSVILPHWLNGMLLHGITTARTLGAPIEESLEIKNKIAMGMLPGPRIVASGPGLTSLQGHPAATMYRQYPELNKRFVRVVSTEDEARVAIKEIIDAGMESPLKLVFHGGEPGEEPYMILGVPALRLAPNLLRAATDEAHARGYSVSVHTNDYEDTLAAVLTGVDGIEHGVVSSVIPDGRLLQAMVERDTFLVSTLRLHQVYHQPEELAAASSNLKSLHDGGVRVVAGSDTPVGWTYPGLNTIYEIELLVAAGLTPLEALQAATFNAALSLEQEDQIGRVREGLLADLVILEGDVMQDISRIRYPRYVIKSGRVVRGLEFVQ